jgi:hypothetical protein
MVSQPDRHMRAYLVALLLIWLCRGVELLAAQPQAYTAEDLLSRPDLHELYERPRGVVERLVGPFWRGERSYAIVIGLGAYTHPDVWKSLVSPRYDAVHMFMYLVEEAGFDYVVLLTDRSASRDTITYYMEEELPRRVSENDRVVFYFSGHGTQRILDSSTGRRRGYLPMLDSRRDSWADMISMDDIKVWDENLGGARHVLFLLDSCFSGLVGHEQKGPSAPEYLDRPGHHLLAAGTEGENATGLVDGSGSLFTAAFLEGIRGAADKVEPYGLVHLGELFEYIRRTVYEQNAKQTPSHSVLSGTGEFYMVTDPARAKASAGELYAARLEDKGAARTLTADAGPDQKVERGAIVHLDGTRSCGPPARSLDCRWMAPPGVALNDSAVARPSFRAGGGGPFVFALVVGDGQTESAPDTVVVRLNNPPVAVAATDQAAPIEAGDLVQLDGTGSYDPDWDALTYRWSVPAGVELSSPTAARPTFRTTVAGRYRARLVVSDGAQESPSAEVSLRVARALPKTGVTVSLVSGLSLFSQGEHRADGYEDIDDHYGWATSIRVGYQLSGSHQLEFALTPFSYAAGKAWDLGVCTAVSYVYHLKQPGPYGGTALSRLTHVPFENMGSVDSNRWAVCALAGFIKRLNVGTSRLVPQLRFEVRKSVYGRYYEDSARTKMVAKLDQALVGLQWLLSG